MIEYVLIGLTVILIGLVLVLVFRKPKTQESLVFQNELGKHYADIKVYFEKEYSALKMELQQLVSKASKENQTDLVLFKDKIMEHIERQLGDINTKVDQRLGEGFKETTTTFTKVIERLAKIDEAQKKIESLSTEVVSLNDLLTDKKTRGIFGEVQLYQILSAVMGDNKALYEKQVTLPNGLIADALIHAPMPVGHIAVDSKFPLDNYKRMIDKSLSDFERKNAEKEFKNDIKKHINDIGKKYIVEGFTGDQAFMFVPAEAIFAEIYANHDDLVDYANKNKVWLVSPTTLIASLSMIQMVVNNIERDLQAKVIIDELNKLGDEFKRYSDRWDKLNQSIKKLADSAKDVTITSEKISKKFKHISDAKFDYLDNQEEDTIEEDTVVSDD